MNILFLVGVYALAMIAIFHNDWSQGMLLLNVGVAGISFLLGSAN